MKLSKAQQALLNTMRNMKTGERVTRHWQSNNYIVHLGTGIEHAREATVKALIRAGLVKEYPHPGNHQYMLLILNRAESPISYAADDGSQNRQPDDITPDPAEPDYDALTVTPALTPAEPVTGFMRPCERCNGTGTIDRGGTSPWRIVHCPDCGGTGIYDEVLIAARDGREYDAHVREQERMLNERLDYEENHRAELDNPEYYFSREYPDLFD